MLVGSYAKHCYGKQPSAFGPYMRLLYRLFKYIENSDLDDVEKAHYVKIASASIPEGAVLVLALNGLTRHGRDNFKPLIERFGLLEHLHPAYESAFRDALSLAYRDEAFEFGGFGKPTSTGKPPLSEFEFKNADVDDESLMLH